jgi:hypothetical protein
MGKRKEIVGWHSITIEMVNKDANCSLDVITPNADRINSIATDPDVVAISWQFGSQSFTVMTSQITRVIVESLEPRQLEDADLDELFETATLTTASVQYRTRTSREYSDGPQVWHLAWPHPEEIEP